MILSSASFNPSKNRGKQCFIVGRLYLFAGFFWSSPICQSWRYKLNYASEGPLMETMCTTTHILKCLQFPLVKREQHKGWNWGSREEQDCRGSRAQQAHQDRTPGSKGNWEKTSQPASARTPQERHLHMAIENTMRELLCIQKQEVFWGQIHSTVL